MDNFEELTKKYVEAEKIYKEFVGQFVTVGWGENIDFPKKSLTRDDVERIKQLKREVDEANDEWMRALNSRVE